MPSISAYKCSRCDLFFPAGSGGYLYVINDKGQKVPCPHPAENRVIQEVLGLKRITLKKIPFIVKAVFYTILRMRSRLLELQYKNRTVRRFRVESRLGYNSHCLCLSCLGQFDLDLGEREDSRDSRNARDQRLCPKCKSSQVKTVLELVGTTCPKCKMGKIEKEWLGSL